MRKLLLHSCCAPCTSGVLPHIDDYDITLLFYNPNIDTIEEYNKRASALVEYVDKYNKEYNKDIKYIIVPYNHEEFIEKIVSLENEKEGGARCYKCIDIRLQYTAKYASDNGYDIFSSTLSVSPHKNNVMINEIGDRLSKDYMVDYLHSNWKKNNGFLNSLNNSKKYNIYRQNYCGCEFAKSHLNK